MARTMTDIKIFNDGSINEFESAPSKIKDF